MGTDIYSHVERQNNADIWEWVREDLFPNDDMGEGYTHEPFAWRSYAVFGFLADVRNYSHSPVIAEPRGLPDDVSPEVRQNYDEWGDDALSPSWLSVAELVAYDYDQVFWDRRIDGAALAREGEGEHLPLRQFLGSFFFRDLGILMSLSRTERVRIVFWFDT